MTTGQIGTFLTPSVVYHGQGALLRLKDLLAKFGSRHPCIVTDPGVIKAGILDLVTDVLGSGVPCCDKVRPEPSCELVGQCVQFMRREGCDLVIGLGGGSALDVAKMAAAMVTNEGDARDYFGVGKIPRPGLPLVAIPTTAGTGSEVSPAAVFVDPRNGNKVGARSDVLMPQAAILDPVMTATLPQPVTASTGVDALTHAIECCTAPAATLLSDMAAERAIELIAKHLPVAYANGADLLAREGQLMGSYLAGLSLSIANVGVVHALAQTLGGLYHVPHGVANALFLPYVMAFNRIGCREKYAKVAALMGERVDGLSLDDASLAAVDIVRAFSRSLGIPQRIRDLDAEVPEDALDAIAARCLETQGRLIANNPRALSLTECRALLGQAY